MFSSLFAHSMQYLNLFDDSTQKNCDIDNDDVIREIYHIHVASLVLLDLSHDRIYVKFRIPKLLHSEVKRGKIENFFCVGFFRYFYVEFQQSIK